MASERKTLHWVDFAVFGASLLASLAIGIYIGWKNRKKQNTEGFLMANRSMGLLPITLSQFVGWFSALSVLGDPAEAYYYGTAYWYLPLGQSLCLITTLYFAPKYQALSLTSAYELFDKHFGPMMRTLGSLVYNIATIVYLAIALYAPAMGVSQMSGLNIYLCIVAIGIVCMIYTSLGGMAAVLWVDTMQCFVMMGGLFSVLIVGVLRVGGVNQVITLARQNGRMTANNFDPNPLLRASFWSYFVGGYFRAFKSYIGEQICIQRYCVTRSKKVLLWSVILQIPLVCLIMSLFASIGITMSAFYIECDPLENGEIDKSDQLLPLFAMDTLGHIPGLNGLFMAAFVSAALSTLSSQHNCVVTITLKDFVQPCLKKLNKGRDVKDRTLTFVAVGMALGVGILNIVLSLPVPSLQDTGVFALSASITGALKGPLASMFTLALLCPFIDYASAVITFLICNAISVWLIIGNTMYPPASQRLSGGTNCTGILNGTDWTSLPLTSPFLGTTSAPQTGFQLTDLYHLAPLHYGTVACISTLVIGVVLGGISKLVRLVFGTNGGTDTATDTYELKDNDITSSSIGLDFGSIQNISNNGEFKKY